MIYVLPIAFAVACILLSPRYLHMLQLSSYQTPSFWRWLRDNVHDLALLLWPSCFVLILGLWEFEWLVIPAAVLLFASSLNSAFRRSAKKPLKYTARVWRIFTVQIILICGISLFGMLLHYVPRVYFLWYGAWFLALPTALIAANWITMPVQKLINNGYINDAKKKLASHPNLTVIGVTGSFGKTSMKFFLQKLLSVRYNTLMTPESYNTPMGVVRTIRELLNATHEFFICEMGARHVGDIREICDIVNPTHGILTSIGEQHLETFRNIENIIKTKFELIDALPDKGHAFLSWGCEPVRDYSSNGKASAVRYAISDTQNGALDYRAFDISANTSGMQFTVTAKNGETMRFTTKLLGAHNVENLLGAIAAANTLGIPLSSLAGAVRSLEAVPHRLQLIPGETIIVDDAFNSNPTGAKAALDALALFDGTKILITPGMVELGERQDELNGVLGTQAAAVCDYICLVGEKQTAPIAKGIEQAGFPKEKIFVFEDVLTAISHAKVLPYKNKVILLENDLPDNY